MKDKDYGTHTKKEAEETGEILFPNNEKEYKDELAPTPSPQPSASSPLLSKQGVNRRKNIKQPKPPLAAPAPDLEGALHEHRVVLGDQQDTFCLSISRETKAKIKRSAKVFAFMLPAIAQAFGDSVNALSQMVTSAQFVGLMPGTVRDLPVLLPSYLKWLLIIPSFNCAGLLCLNAVENLKLLEEIEKTPNLKIKMWQFTKEHTGELVLLSLVASLDALLFSINLQSLYNAFGVSVDRKGHAGYWILVAISTGLQFLMINGPEFIKNIREDSNSENDYTRHIRANIENGCLPAGIKTETADIVTMFIRLLANLPSLAAACMAGIFCAVEIFAEASYYFGQWGEARDLIPRVAWAPSLLLSMPYAVMRYTLYGVRLRNSLGSFIERVSHPDYSPSCGNPCSEIRSARDVLQNILGILLFKYPVASAAAILAFGALVNFAYILLYGEPLPSTIDPELPKPFSINLISLGWQVAMVISAMIPFFESYKVEGDSLKEFIEYFQRSHHHQLPAIPETILGFPIKKKVHAKQKFYNAGRLLDDTVMGTLVAGIKLLIDLIYFPSGVDSHNVTIKQTSISALICGLMASDMVGIRTAFFSQTYSGGLSGTSRECEWVSMNSDSEKLTNSLAALKGCGVYIMSTLPTQDHAKYFDDKPAYIIVIQDNNTKLYYGYYTEQEQELKEISFVEDRNIHDFIRVLNISWNPSDVSEVPICLIKKLSLKQEQDLTLAEKILPVGSLPFLTNLAYIHYRNMAEEKLLFANKEKGELIDLELPFEKIKEIECYLNPSVVNINAYYDEWMIRKVWEAHIKKKNLGLWHDTLSKDPEAVILIKSDGSLYKREGDNKSLSLCSSVEYKVLVEQGGNNAITHDLEIALHQIIHWNSTHPSDQITNHIIQFPYHIHDKHWGLGTLTIDFSGRSFKIKVLDPFGGGSVNERVLVEIMVLINQMQEFMGFSPVALEKHTHNRQQFDQTSCGAITAENGKYIIDDSNYGKFLRPYPFGAYTPRKKHIIEVNEKEFTKRQQENKEYLPVRKSMDASVYNSILEEIKLLPADKKISFDKTINKIKNTRREAKDLENLKLFILENSSAFQRTVSELFDGEDNKYRDIDFFIQIIEKYASTLVSSDTVTKSVFTDGSQSFGMEGEALVGNSSKKFIVTIEIVSQKPEQLKEGVFYLYKLTNSVNVGDLSNQQFSIFCSVKDTDKNDFNLEITSFLILKLKDTTSDFFSRINLQDQFTHCTEIEKQALLGLANIIMKGIDASVNWEFRLQNTVQELTEETKLPEHEGTSTPASILGHTVGTGELTALKQEQHKAPILFSEEIDQIPDFIDEKLAGDLSELDAMVRKSERRKLYGSELEKVSEMSDYKPFNTLSRLYLLWKGFSTFLIVSGTTFGIEYGSRNYFLKIDTQKGEDKARVITAQTMGAILGGIMAVLCYRFSILRWLMNSLSSNRSGFFGKKQDMQGMQEIINVQASETQETPSDQSRTNSNPVEFVTSSEQGSTSQQKIPSHILMETPETSQQTELLTAATTPTLQQ